MQERGHNAVVVPMHVSAADFDEFMRGFARSQNVDGIIATIPHKFAAFAYCATATERAKLLGAANTLRRNEDGSWHGDMLDGIGFVAGLHKAGCVTKGKRALLVGAGGAGSAIALALLDEGISQLAIHDVDIARRDRLIARLARPHPDKVTIGSHDPDDFDVIVNATPMGMKADDPEPMQIARLRRGSFVGDVITVPEVTPLLAAARAKGCGTQTGVGMFAQVQNQMLEFLMQSQESSK